MAAIPTSLQKNIKCQRHFTCKRQSVAKIVAQLIVDAFDETKAKHCQRHNGPRDKSPQLGYIFQLE